MHTGKRVLILDASLVSARPQAFAAYSEDFIMGPMDAYFASIGVTTDFGIASELTTDEIEQAIDRVDALIIPGGEDVHPDIYNGERRYPNRGLNTIEGDIGQITAILYAIDTGKRVFGICRGQQVMNVALGGTLIQHLDGHKNKGYKDYRDRFVTTNVVSKDGFFPEISSGQCSHHQAVKVLGEGLEAASFSHDGIIEGIRHESGLARAVQFHPESEKTFMDQMPVFADWLLSETNGARAKIGYSDKYRFESEVNIYEDHASYSFQTSLWD